MAYFCELCGHEAAKVIVRGGPQPLASLFGWRLMMTATFQATVRMHGGNPSNDSASHDALLELFTGTAGVPIPFDQGAFDDMRYVPATGVTLPDEHKRLAQYIGIVVGGIVRSIDQAMRRADQGGSVSQPGPPGRHQPTPPRYSDALHSMRDSVPSSRRSAFDGLVRSVRRFEDAEEQVYATATATTVLVDLDVAREAIMRVVRGLPGLIRAFCQHVDVESLIQDALDEAERKLPMAAAIATFAHSDEFGRIFGDPRSSMRIGNRVHQELQRRYELSEPSHDVITERWDPNMPNPRRRGGRGWSYIAVTGPTTGGQPEALNQIVGRRDPEGFFACLRIAFSSITPLNSTFERTLRADLVDKDRRQLWEIKPMLGVVGGVLQEIRYRLLFNLTRELLTCLGRRAPESKLLVGEDIQFANGMSLAPVNISAEAREACIAVPFQLLPQLGGIVMYFILEAIEDAARVTALTRLLQDFLRNRLRELRRERTYDDDTGSGHGQPVPVYEIDWERAILIIIVLMLFIVLLIIAWELIVGGAVAEAIIQALGALGVLVAPYLDDFINGARNLIPTTNFFGGALHVSLDPQPGASPTSPPATLDFLGLRIQGLPPEQVPNLLASAGRILPVARRLLLDDLGRNLRTARTATS